MCVFLGCVCVEGRQGLSSSKPFGLGMVDKDIQEADCLGDCLAAGAQEVRGPMVSVSIVCTRQLCDLGQPNPLHLTFQDRQ